MRTLKFIINFVIVLVIEVGLLKEICMQRCELEGQGRMGYTSFYPLKFRIYLSISKSFVSKIIRALKFALKYNRRTEWTM